MQARLRAEVGEEIFKSWFAAMGHRRRRRRHRAAVGADPLPQELGAVALRRQAARLLEGRAPVGASHRSGASLRGAAQRDRQGEAERAGAKPRARPRTARPSAAKRAPRNFRRRPHTRRSAARRSIRGSCSTPSWSAAPTRSRMRRPSRSRSARRGEPVMFNPLYVHAGVGPRQDAPAAIDRLGRQRHSRPQGALSHRREVHVRLRGGAQGADRARLQGSAARHRRAGDRRPAVPAGQVDAGRVLPHAQCADRCRPPGGDRGRPAAERPGKPRRPRALAPCRRARGRDGLARRGAAARDPQEPGGGRARASCGLRRAGARARLHRQDR